MTALQRESPASCIIISNCYANHSFLYQRISDKTEQICITKKGIDLGMDGRNTNPKIAGVLCVFETKPMPLQMTNAEYSKHFYLNLTRNIYFFFVIIRCFLDSKSTSKFLETTQL